MWTTQLEAGGILSDEETQSLVFFLTINFKKLFEIFQKLDVEQVRLSNRKELLSFAFFSQAICYHLMAIALYGQRTQINENLTKDRFKFDPQTKILQYFPTFEKVARKTDGIVVMNWGLTVIYCVIKFIRPIICGTSDVSHNFLWVRKNGLPLSNSSKSKLIRFFSACYNDSIAVSESRTYRRTMFTKFINGELDDIMKAMDENFTAFSRNLETQFNVSAGVMANFYNRVSPVSTFNSFNEQYGSAFLHDGGLDVNDEIINAANELPEIRIVSKQSLPTKRKYILLHETSFACHNPVESQEITMLPVSDAIIVQYNNGVPILKPVQLFGNCTDLDGYFYKRL